MKLNDDGYCFICGPENPIGLKLDFHFDGRTIRTEFTSKKNYQGYANIVHGGIITALLDEAMVKLSIALGKPAVTARMDVRVRKSLAVGEKITVTAEINKETRKTIDALAKAVTKKDEVIASASGKLIKA